MKVDENDRVEPLPEIKEYEERWIKIFEEIKGEMINPVAFEIMEEVLLQETRGLLLWNIANKEQDRCIIQAKSRIGSYMAKAYALSVSKWKDKHSGIFGFLSPIKKLELGGNIKEVGGNIKLETKS